MDVRNAGSTCMPLPFRPNPCIAYACVHALRHAQRCPPHLTRMLRYFGQSVLDSVPLLRSSFSRTDMIELAGSHISSFHHCSCVSLS